MLDSPSLAESFGSTSSGLLVRVQTGEPEAWDWLVKLYGPLVYHWCRSARLQPADAADVVQEVFQSVFSAVGRFRHDDPAHTFRGWLRTITGNKLRDCLRRREHQLEATGGSDAQRQMLTLAMQGPLADESFDKQLLLQQGLALLQANFEEQTWQAFWRVTIEGQYAVDVAADLGITANAVYKAKSRVLASLRAELRGLLS